MASVVFRCPNKKLRVQAWTADDALGDEDAFFPVECIACRQIHYVNPATGRVLGSADLTNRQPQLAASSLSSPAAGLMNRGKAPRANGRPF